jgi:putative hydrolase of the HAD superfamily
MIEPKAVILDYGNVLCQPQQSADVDKMAEESGIRRPQFDNLYWQFRDPYDKGETDGATYWGQIAGGAGVRLRSGSVERLIRLDNESWMHPCQPVIDWAGVLRAHGLKVGLLSNMHMDLRQYLAETCDWLRGFDHLTFSCDVGAIKPHEDIYRHCLDGLGVAPQEAVFLDDRHPNIEGAQKVGIHGVLFESAEQARRAVAERFRLPELRC